MSTDGEPTVEDFRDDIKARIEPGVAKLVVLWSDGRVDEYDVIDTRRPGGGGLIAKTPGGEQVEVSPALEWVLVGRVPEGELQP